MAVESCMEIEFICVRYSLLDRLFVGWIYYITICLR